MPEELIAQHPSGVGGQDKLMLLDRATGEVEHHMMDDLPDLIEPGTLMIFNNSRVRRARVYGIKETTSRETEFMFLMTGILRRTLLVDRSRRENDAEQSWHIAVMTLLFKEYCIAPVDVERATKMCLVHDLIGIYAGDTFA